MGGIILDAAEAVLVEVTQEWITRCINGNCALSFYKTPPVYEKNFNHPLYKRAVSQRGLCETIEHPNGQVAVQLTEEQQLRRFETLHQYLVDNKIRVKLVTDEVSHLVTSKMPVDDLFSLDYMVIDIGERRRHYEKMIEITGVSLFEQWYG
ncbi:hypothetical protein PN36_14260 [Candidatus Thiomargarita nelsonii]|uniref:Uncharacterized protein n=1 Tax=Candidatus Thiomargarita nelsonii TaxID=1003181 RepID=A0A0A6S209_9GAMM|nr:hypothetical protein PN36_14260 [Candidatus Thiomargarita nelsonii]